MRIDTLHQMTSSRLVVVTIEATLRTAAFGLSKPHVGLLVVCDENRKAAGVVSKSDIVLHLARVDSPEGTVATLMSWNIVFCSPEDDLHVTWQRMAAQSLQNMPVLNSDSRPLGVLDIRDALKALFEQEENQERLLINYTAGVGYH